MELVVQRTELAVLNHLIEAGRDAERGFAIGAHEVRARELKRLFSDWPNNAVSSPRSCLPYAQRQLKAHLASNPDRAVLEEAERGERFALAAYDEAVNDLVPPLLLSLS